VPNYQAMKAYNGVQLYPRLRIWETWICNFSFRHFTPRKSGHVIHRVGEAMAKRVVLLVVVVVMGNIYVHGYVT